MCHLQNIKISVQVYVNAIYSCYTNIPLQRITYFGGGGGGGGGIICSLENIDRIIMRTHCNWHHIHSTHHGLLYFPISTWG